MKLHICKTCKGQGTVDTDLDGFSFDDPTCPDCDGSGLCEDHGGAILLGRERMRNVTHERQTWKAETDTGWTDR